MDRHMLREDPRIFDPKTLNFRQLFGILGQINVATEAIWMGARMITRILEFRLCILSIVAVHLEHCPSEMLSEALSRFGRSGLLIGLTDYDLSCRLVIEV